MDLKKARWKKQGHCYSKREEARLPDLKTRIVGADWPGDCEKKNVLVIEIFLKFKAEGQ